MSIQTQPGIWKGQPEPLTNRLGLVELDSGWGLEVEQKKWVEP